MAGTPAAQDQAGAGQPDFAAEMRAKAQSKRKAAAPAAVPVSHCCTIVGHDMHPCLWKFLCRKSFGIQCLPLLCRGLLMLRVLFRSLCLE